MNIIDTLCVGNALCNQCDNISPLHKAYTPGSSIALRLQPSPMSCGAAPFYLDFQVFDPFPCNAKFPPHKICPHPRPG